MRDVAPESSQDSFLRRPISSWLRLDGWVLIAALIVAAAVAGNHHDVGLQAVADFFDMDGWRVVLLGANVPTGDLIEAVGDYQADLLALSAAQRTQLPTLRATIEAIRRGPSASIKILVGGRALAGAADLAAEFGADGCAAGPAEAVALGNALVGVEPAGSLP